VKHVLGSKTAKEFADRYQELVESKNFLPIEDTTDPGIGSSSRPRSTRRQYAENLKPIEHPKPWNGEENKTLVYVVNKYEDLDI
jgi:hypothetical protein